MIPPQLILSPAKACGHLACHQHGWLCIIAMSFSLALSVSAPCTAVLRSHGNHGHLNTVSKHSHGQIIGAYLGRAFNFLDKNNSQNLFESVCLMICFFPPSSSSRIMSLFAQCPDFHPSHPYCPHRHHCTEGFHHTPFTV